MKDRNHVWYAVYAPLCPNGCGQDMIWNYDYGRWECEDCWNFVCPREKIDE